MNNGWWDLSCRGGLRRGGGCHPGEGAAKPRGQFPPEGGGPSPAALNSGVTGVEDANTANTGSFFQEASRTGEAKTGR